MRCPAPGLRRLDGGRPLEAAAGVDRFVWRASTGAEQPVRVVALRLTAEAVTGAPVQI